MYINMIYYSLFTNLASHNCVLYNTLIKYYDYRFDMFIELEQGREVGHLCDFVHHNFSMLVSNLELQHNILLALLTVRQSHFLSYCALGERRDDRARRGKHIQLQVLWNGRLEIQVVNLRA